MIRCRSSSNKNDIVLSSVDDLAMVWCVINIVSHSLVVCISIMAVAVWSSSSFDCKLMSV